MIRTLVLLVAVLVSVPALAEEDSRFAALREAAQPVGGLSHFLEKYIGECSVAGGVDGECRQNSTAFRQKMKGKKLFMIVTEESAGMLSPGDYDVRSGEYTINVTPFFGAGGYALTMGVPKKTDANGNPILPLLSVPGETRDGWSQGRFQRMVSGRELRLHVVFSPQEVWNMPKKGGGKIHGVRAKIEAILVTIGRTGEQVGLWFAK